MKNLMACILMGAALTVGGCGGGGDGDDEDGGGQTASTLTVSGTVNAAGGALATGRPQGLQRMWAWLVGEQAVASLYGVSPAAGAVVKLYKINSAGVVSGDALATTTADGAGNYSLTATGSASDLTVGMGLIVRAGTTESLTAIVASTTTNIDPVSDATFNLLKENVGDVTKISLAELATLQAEVAVYANQIDFAAATTNAGLVTAIQNEFRNSVTASYMLSNAGAAEQVCGTVTADGAAVADIVIEARDFNDNVLRAKATTGADGKYCMNMAAGDYVVDARNDTDHSYGASEWYNTSGGASENSGADKVALAAGESKTIDFQLAAGGRIAGKVKAGAAVTVDSRTWNLDDPLPDVTVTVRRYDNFALVATTRSAADGSYQLNVAPGDYFVMATNLTRQPFATEVYDGAGGRAIWEYAKRVVVSAAQTSNIAFPLLGGKRLAGVVKKNDGSAAAGQRVRIDYINGGSVERINTRVDGSYRIWLRPNNQYDVFSRGQTETADLTTQNADAIDFDAPMAEVTVKLVEAADTNKPVPDAKLFLRDATDTTSWHFVSQEPSRGDGSAVLYSPYDAVTVTNRTYKLEIRLDGGQYLATQIYNGKTYLGDATATITIPSDQAVYDLGTVAIAEGGVLKGKLLLTADTDGTQGASNQTIRVRRDGTTNSYRLVHVSTAGDGTFSVSLPAGTYQRIILGDNTDVGCTSDCAVTKDNSVTINANQVTDLGNVKLE